MKILIIAAKILGLASALDWTGISPKYGVIIFLAASAAKDAINKVGDYLDDKVINQSFPAKS
jgi:hypothetical protein